MLLTIKNFIKKTKLGSLTEVGIGFKDSSANHYDSVNPL